MRARFLTTLTTALLVALALAGCAGKDDGPTPISGATTVDMVNSRFIPDEITITVGTTVTWVNKDPLLHNVEPEDKGQFPGSGSEEETYLDDGDSWSYTFDKPGTYYYYCAPHAKPPQDGEHAKGMTARIVVV